MEIYPPPLINEQVKADYSHNYPSQDRLLEIRKIVEGSIDDNDKLDRETLKSFDDANLSIGQIWKSKGQGSDIKITYLGRNVAGVKFEEVGTGKIGAFCIEIFLERFYYEGFSL